MSVIVYCTLLHKFSLLSPVPSVVRPGFWQFFIQRTADGAARAAGTVYRMVAGTADDELLAYTNDLELPPLEMAVAAATSPTVTTPISTAKPPPPPPPAPSAPPSKPTVGAWALPHRPVSRSATLLSFLFLFLPQLFVWALVVCSYFVSL